jgi:hypothetical protein
MADINRYFWWIFVILMILYTPFLRPWWWLFVPVLLAMELEMVYLWWVRWDYNHAKIQYHVLEVVTPKEILVPLKAMEDVFAVMWGPLYAPPNWRETYCEGEGDAYMSWEIVSIEGSLHFYIRVASAQRPALEAILYSHYPDLEIREVPDYTKAVPQDAPNKEWDAYGEDFILRRPPAYPIKTYEKFFEPQGEKISAEEKRIDPLSSLLESMSKLGPGEQFWVQFNMTGIEESEWKDEGKKIIGKIAKLPEKKKKTIFDEIYETGYNVVMGPIKEGSGEGAKYKWFELGKTESGDRELLMTPGEREEVTEIENKLKKPVFRVNIRGVYVAKRENWKSSNKTLTRAYFSHFQTQNLNLIKFSGTTRPKVHYFFRKSRVFARARRIYRNYLLRFPPFFPDMVREVPILNPEEMATIYHFPIKITGLVFPTMTRVESKKGGPPPNLPT